MIVYKVRIVIWTLSTTIVHSKFPPSLYPSPPLPGRAKTAVKSETENAHNTLKLLAITRARMNITFVLSPSVTNSLTRVRGIEIFFRERSMHLFFFFCDRINIRHFSPARATHTHASHTLLINTRITRNDSLLNHKPQISFYFFFPFSLSRNIYIYTCLHVTIQNNSRRRRNKGRVSIRSAYYASNYTYYA